MRRSFRARYEEDVAHRLAQVRRKVLVTEEDLADLPPLLRTYLHRVGVVGHPRVQNFRARFRGELRSSHESGWMQIRAEQYTFLGHEPARLFLLKAAKFGIPFEASHRFVGPRASMQVRVASLFQVVNAKGPEMDQGETVTFFNDLCLLAPAALLDADVSWGEAYGRTLKGTLRHQGHRVSAILTFDGHGDLVDFVSEDRFQSGDGRTFLKYPWSTPVQAYGDLSGFHLMSKGDALWLEPAGPFPYARFEVELLVYNVGPSALPGRP
jgi:hypothetical protein